MAPIKSLGNVVVSYGGTDITAYCNQADLSAAIERLDVTDLADTAKSTIAGDAEWTIQLGGAWASEVDAVLGPDAVTTGTARNASIAIDGGAATTTYSWTAAAEISDWTIQSSTGDFVKWTATLSLSGAPNRAVA